MHCQGLAKQHCPQSHYCRCRMQTSELLLGNIVANGCCCTQTVCCQYLLHSPALCLHGAAGRADIQAGQQALEGKLDLLLRRQQAAIDAMNAANSQLAALQVCVLLGVLGATITIIHGGCGGERGIGSTACLEGSHARESKDGPGGGGTSDMRAANLSPSQAGVRISHVLTSPSYPGHSGCACWQSSCCSC